MSVVKIFAMTLAAAAAIAALAIFVVNFVFKKLADRALDDLTNEESLDEKAP